MTDKFEINWDRVNTIDDIKKVFKTMQLGVMLDPNNVPPQLQELYDGGYLKKVEPDISQIMGTLSDIL